MDVCHQLAVASRRWQTEWSNWGMRGGAGGSFLHPPPGLWLCEGADAHHVNFRRDFLLVILFSNLGEYVGHFGSICCVCKGKGIMLTTISKLGYVAYM